MHTISTTSTVIIRPDMTWLSTKPDAKLATAAGTGTELDVDVVAAVKVAVSGLLNN